MRQQFNTLADLADRIPGPAEAMAGIYISFSGADMLHETGIDSGLASAESAAAFVLGSVIAVHGFFRTQRKLDAARNATWPQAEEDYFTADLSRK